MEYKYDPEADILAITLSKEPFDYAEENGDFIVHFSKNNKPVYVEILDAHKFIEKAVTVLPKPSRKTIIQHMQTI